MKLLYEEYIDHLIKTRDNAKKRYDKTQEDFNVQLEKVHALRKVISDTQDEVRKKVLIRSYESLKNRLITDEQMVNAKRIKFKEKHRAVKFARRIQKSKLFKTRR